MLGDLRPAAVLIVLFTLLTGVAYPLAVTGIARIVVPAQASGSLVSTKGHVIGSRLIGQPFDDPRYFWGRPSATTPVAYNAIASTGSNLGPSNPVLIRAIQDRVAALRAADPDHAAALVPVDLVTSSASGLDPDISLAAALYQVPRVARARQISEGRLQTVVESHIERGIFGLLREPRVNVLLLNMGLDELAQPSHP